MNPINNSQFAFIDDDGTRKVFLREKYFEFVCLLITDYYKKEVPQNDFYNYFVNLLNNLDDYNGVYFVEHYMPPYWALSIIENDNTKNSFNYDERMKEISTKFRRENNLSSFIIDNNILS